MRIKKEKERVKSNGIKINFLILFYVIIFVMVFAYFFITTLRYKVALENYRNFKSAEENIYEEIKEKEEILKKLKKMNESNESTNTVLGDDSK